MARISLEPSLYPPQLEVSVQIRRTDGEIERRTAIIDTGAQLSLFPIKFLSEFRHEIIHPRIELEQAGIANQRFSAVEARVTLMLED
jgi:hypothetical protein